MTTITVETTVKLSIENVWECWTLPKHIIQWNFATDEWHCPAAENDLRSGGRFSWRMEAKDGSMGFDYSGVYEHISQHDEIVVRLDDDRQVNVKFIESGGVIRVVETFEVEDENTLEQQRLGWQAILDNFKNYAEKKRLSGCVIFKSHIVRA